MNKDGLPVLHVAVKNAKLDAIPVLVEAGAEINAKEPKCVFTHLLDPKKNQQIRHYPK